MRHALAVSAGLALLLTVPRIAEAQAPSEGPLWYISYFQIPWSKVDSLNTLLRDSEPVVQEAIESGEILDYRTLIHNTATVENVVVMIKYPSWASIAGWQGLGKAHERLEPDAAKRKPIDDGFNWVFEDVLHRDAIYQEPRDVPEDEE